MKGVRVEEQSSAEESSVQQQFEEDEIDIAAMPNNLLI